MGPLQELQQSYNRLEKERPAVSRLPAGRSTTHREMPSPSRLSFRAPTKERESGERDGAVRAALWGGQSRPTLWLLSWVGPSERSRPSGHISLWSDSTVPVSFDSCNKALPPFRHHPLQSPGNVFGQCSAERVPRVFFTKGRRFSKQSKRGCIHK